jgi:hypothetical protein
MIRHPMDPIIRQILILFSLDIPHININTPEEIVGSEHLISPRKRDEEISRRNAKQQNADAFWRACAKPENSGSVFVDITAKSTKK